MPHVGPLVALLLMTTACAGPSITVSTTSPTPGASTSPGRDAALDLVPECRPDGCSVSGSTDRADGTRVVVVDELPDLGLARVLLIRQDKVLDTRALDSEFTDGVRTDTTGNLLVVLTGNTATSVVPLRVVGDRFKDVPVTGPDSGMYGDNNLQFVDQAGVLDIVTGQHAMLEGDVATATVTWRWNGTAYVAGPCVGHPAACP